MTKYIVTIREIFVERVEVEANNIEEAKEKAGFGDGSRYDGIEHPVEHEEYWNVESVQ